MAEPSLIPKSSQDYINRPHGERFGFVIVIGILFFMLSMGALGGLIYYKSYLNKQIDGMVSEIKKKEENFKGSNIEEWARTAASIDLAKEVLANHRYVSNVFTFISKNTLPDVRFSGFSFDAKGSKIDMKAEARNYTALAQQREIFSKNSSITSVALSDFSLDKSGKIIFSIELKFNNTLIYSQ